MLPSVIGTRTKRLSLPFEVQMRHDLRLAAFNAVRDVGQSSLRLSSFKRESTFKVLETAYFSQTQGHIPAATRCRGAEREVVARGKPWSYGHRSRSQISWTIFLYISFAELLRSVCKAMAIIMARRQAVESCVDH